MRSKKNVWLAVSLICLMTACGADINVTLSGETSEFGQVNRTPEVDRDISSVKPIPLEELTGDSQPGPEPVPASTPTPTPSPQEIYITISAAGDVSLGNYFGQGYEASFLATYKKEQSFSYFFENVYDIFAADDMTIVNLEGPLTRAEERREEQEFCISGDPEFVNILTEGSVEAVSMGNNHRLDYLQQGSDDTVKVLEEVGIPYAYDNYTGTYVTSQGIMIGFVSVSALGMGARVSKYIQEGIEDLREKGCDLILVCCHWGIERDYYPNEYQENLGRQCIDWGADMVIGHHPHVLQGIEEYQGKYIFYSLGNFCFGANRNPPDKDCLIVQQTFTFIDGVKQDETQLKVIPCSVSSVKNRNDYKPTPATGEEAKRILDKLNEYSLELGLRFDEDGFPVN